MTEDGLADLKGQNLYLLINNRSFIAYWKGDYPSWTRMGYVPQKLKILY
jgi:hypothetical protein